MVKKLPKTNFIPTRFSLGVSLIVLGLIFFLGNKNVKPQTYYDSFEYEPVRLEGLSEEETDLEMLPIRIVIPKVNIDIPVNKSKIINGYWEVFDDKAGWGEGSGIPGQKGNQVIFAHARKGLFQPLQSIEVGDTIYIFTEKAWFSYRIKEIKQVFPGNTEVISPSDDEVLTLYTCSGFTDTKRLIVISERT